ncbi:hypothetical protein B0T21DRAFT_452669 [Apiosordaria backusii]|uniref:Conidiation-specific protein 8 n=1 Tax=Apiosordaria backusii TaxID=314023 RepID=A0AA40B7U6_9PEZI|nr:hypothetical protein B0T21DRAFT_452669 [Apiosordaria backusii]
MADNLPSGPEFRTGRADSTFSTSSTGTTNTNFNAGGMPTSPTQAPRRRSGLFEGLEAQKRPSDPASVARRQSMSDQRPKTGFIGSMWNNWVHGSS